MKYPDLKRYGVLAGVALLITAGYLLWSARIYGVGFPLDDAWIHQTFARNLVEEGQWTFNTGKVAAGSTSPLWTLLLSVGYLLHFQPVWWAMALGVGGLIITGIVCERIWRRYRPSSSKLFLPLFGLLVISEWHIVWAALSGMETIIYILVVCLTFYLLLNQNPRWFLAGLLTGLLVWIRPDGLTMLGPALLLAVCNRESWKKRFSSIALVLAGASVLIAAYMVFNYSLNGSVWPNTLQAKQTEYAILREESIILRFIKLFGLLHIGVGSVLVPGFIAKLVRVIKEHDHWGIAANLWVAGFVFIYALQLPVTYQHIRYLIPVIPMFLIMGCAGFAEVFSYLHKHSKKFALFGNAWFFIIVIIQVAFCTLGAKSYAMDVAMIETEMVQTAKWIADNIPAGERIATHDIGALGYFTDNELVDLAGLIDPEVIPVMRNETELLIFIRNRQARYLVTFPDWYPNLVLHGEKIFDTKGKFSPQMGGENMAVYVMQ